MGFFSWDCAECGKSIMNKHADHDSCRRHRGITHVRPDDSLAGEYDGYGSVAGEDIYAWVGDGDRDLGIEISLSSYPRPADRQIKVLHRDCYNGQKYAELPESEMAENQGYWG